MNSKRIVSTVICFVAALAFAVAQDSPITSSLSLRVNSARIEGDGKLTFLKVSAIDSKDEAVLRIVNYTEVVDFGEGEWKYAEVKVLEEDEDTGNVLIHGPVNVSLSPGQHHPARPSCGDGCLFDYDYTLTPRYSDGYLTMFITNGTSIPNKDKWYLPKHQPSDAYVRVIARRMDSPSKTRQTSVQWNAYRPNWNQQLDFGIGVWSSISVRVFDRDVYNRNDDTLSNERTYSLEYAFPTTDKEEEMATYGGGNIKFTYSYL